MYICYICIYAMGYTYVYHVYIWGVYMSAMSLSESPSAMYICSAPGIYVYMYICTICYPALVYHRIYVYRLYGMVVYVYPYEIYVVYV